MKLIIYLLFLWQKFNNMKRLFLFILNLLVYSYIFGQEDSIIPFEKAYKRIYHITKVQNVKLNIDGKLDEPLWETQGEWTERFTQVSPYERVKSNSPTYAKLFYDDKYIYVGIYCKEYDLDYLNRFIGNRDDNSIGDLVSIAFDTYHDFRAAPEFNLNLGGNKTDLIVTDKLEVNKSWNAVWEAKTHIDMTDSCWTAEMRIPFSQIRYNQKSEDGIWGLHIRRINRHRNEVQNWSLIPLKNNGHVFSFGEMHGMIDLPKPKGVEILPYMMGKFRREPKLKESFYSKKNNWDSNAGLDAKFALSDLTLDLTVNPDYGQVELDPSVMNLTAYETFYEEKRPFFLEGKHILDFVDDGDMLFYSRRIGAAPSYKPEDIDNVNSFAKEKEHVPIIGAMKLTGTTRNGWTIGMLESVTAESSVDVMRNNVESKTEVEPLTNFTVARLQKNWNGNTLLGGMLTSVNRALNQPYLEDFMVRNAFTGGIDFTHYFMNRLLYVDAKLMGSSLHGTERAIERVQRNAVHYYQRVSSTDYLGVNVSRRSLSGTGGYVELGKKGNSKWIFSEKFSWSSPGFDLNDVGYLKEADYLLNTTSLSYKQTDTWKKFRSNTITLEQENKWNYGGTSLLNKIELDWTTMFINRYQLTVKQAYNWNKLDTRVLRGGPDLRFNPYFATDIKFNTDTGKRMMLGLDYRGEHDTAGHYNYNTWSPKAAFRIGNHLYMSTQFDYSHNTDEQAYVRSVPTALIPYMTAKMEQDTYGVTLKVQANVTPDFSVQFYGSPFTSIAKYSEFKDMTNTTAHKFKDRFRLMSDEEVEAHNISPDFSFNEFRSNLVARWEYLPGSTLYIVWEHIMSNRDKYYRSGWNDNLNKMFDLPATNTFMVKINYWFNM